MKVQIINKSHHQLPQYATIQSAGVDLRANLSEPIVLAPMQRGVVGATNLNQMLQNALNPAGDGLKRGGFAIGLSYRHTKGIYLLVLYQVKLPLILCHLIGEPMFFQISYHGIGQSLSYPLHHSCVGSISRGFCRLHITLILLIG